MKFSKRIMAGLLCAGMVFSASGCTKLATSPWRDQDTCLVKVGENEISFEEGRVYIYLTEANYENMFLTYRQYGIDYSWDTAAGEDSDRTIGDSIKDNTMDNIIYDEIRYQEAMKKGGYDITKAQEDELKKNAKELMESMSEDTIKKNGFTEDMFFEYQRKSNISQRYAADYLKTFEVTREEAAEGLDYENKYREYKTEYIRYPLTSTDSEGNSLAFTDDAKAAAKSKMEELLAKVKEGTGFEEAIEGVEEVEYNTRDFTVEDKDVADYMKTAAALEKGGISEIFEANDSYFIVKLLDDDSKDAYETAIDNAVESKRQEKYNEALKKLKEETYKTEINEKVWNSVDFGDCAIIKDEFEKAYGVLTKKTDNEDAQ